MSSLKNEDRKNPSVNPTKDRKPVTNSTCHNSFQIPVDQTMRDTASASSRLSKNSAENISTSFVKDEQIRDWRFTAGSPIANEASFTPPTQPPSTTRPIRRPTAKARPVTMNSVPTTQATSTDSSNQGFSAGEWSEKIGSEHFAPPASHSTSTSPSRRPNSRKTRVPNVKPTAGGTAGMFEDDENEGWREIPRPQPGAVPVTANSPTAMDIDTPPCETADPILKAPQTHSARNIPVEPTRPDWRAGDVNSVPSKTAGPTLDTEASRSTFPEKRPFTEKADTQSTATPTSATPFAVHHGGSEDTDDFRTTLSDLKETEPFIDPIPTGLKSFSDLKSTLPFESRPSEQIPIEKRHESTTLDFPIPPVAPRLPPTVAVKAIRPNIAQWRKYAQEFYSYMDKWEAFNAKVVEHFSTRQRLYAARRRQHGSAWLVSSQDGKHLEDYTMELQQDQEVQKKWVDACSIHRDRVREYTEFRDRIK